MQVLGTATGIIVILLLLAMIALVVTLIVKGCKMVLHQLRTVEWPFWDVQDEREAFVVWAVMRRGGPFRH